MADDGLSTKQKARTTASYLLEDTTASYVLEEETEYISGQPVISLMLG